MVSSAPFISDLIKAGKIVVSKVPPFNARRHRYPIYNAILKNESFWESIVAERVLIFQTDSVLCRGAESELSDFDNWAYVGGPWDEQSVCGNGGFSLRSRAKSIKAIQKYGDTRKELNEDLFFCATYGRLGFKKAPWDVGKKFSVERVYHGRPIGVHKIHYEMKDHPDLIEKLYRNCPEARMLAGPECWREHCAKDRAFVGSLNLTLLCREGWQKRAKEGLGKDQLGHCTN